MRNDADKGARSRFSLVCAFRCAWDGIVYAVRTQRNMKIHLGIAVLAVALGFALRIDGASWAAVILCIAAVFAAECVNTAIESVVDLVSPEYHELARRAKDCAAGAVLVFAHRGPGRGRRGVRPARMGALLRLARACFPLAGTDDRGVVPTCRS